MSSDKSSQPQSSLGYDLKAGDLETGAAQIAKAAFLANMSHEMRTPLTVILGFADILKRPAISDALRNDYLGRIERSGNQLLRLIEDLLDLANIEAGSLNLKVGDVDVRATVATVMKKYRSAAESKNLVFESYVDDSIPQLIQSNDLRLQQILENLISNAIKFTDAGTVQLHARRSGDQLSLEVLDTGIGIDDDKQDDLFQPFSQVETARSRSMGGTGIGLVLSKRIAELLGGDLTLKASRKEVGSTFIVSFPGLGESSMASDKTAKAAPTSKDLPLGGVKLLVAEDVLDNQDLFRIVLESAGAEVHIVENGAEAVARVASDVFDVVLMDVQMPVMDGLTATRKIRETGSKIPVIALTAHAMPEEVAKSKAAGCNDHVSKPIKANGLIQSILQVLNRG